MSRRRCAPCDTASPYFGRLTFGGNPTATDVEIIDINIVNGPDIKTDGVDFTVRYSVPLAGGELSAGVTGTNVLSFDIAAWELGSARDALGRLNYNTSLARTTTEWKGRGHLNYRFGLVNVRYVANYIGGIRSRRRCRRGLGSREPAHARTAHDARSVRRQDAAMGLDHQRYRRRPAIR